MRLAGASRSAARLPNLALAGVLVATLLVGVLIVLEAATGWDDAPFHLLAGAMLMVIMLGCWLLWRAQRDAPAFALEERAALERAKQVAETANLAKSRYLANVSHEIRSPLNAISGYAQLVEQDADVSPKEAARVIRRCAEHMTSLVEGLLDISRAENGVLRVRSEIVSFPEFLDQIVSMMRPAATAKGLEFIHERSGPIPGFVRLDQSRFRQALINLLANAIKFTDAGRVTFRVAYRGQIATFDVIDTGPGIAPEDQLRIFDPYERGEAGQLADSGIGLGLPITKAIVGILGGNLELESMPGKGARFRVTMMLGEVAQALAAKPAARRISGYEGPMRSILVVDDDPDQRAFLEKFLTGCGFEVVSVSNGETALGVCTGRSIDLAVLDITLPGISGWETAVLLRERMADDLFIIMASANAQEFHRPEFHKPQHDHFFVKPYRLEDMAEAIGALLKLTWKWEAPEGAGGPGDGADHAVLTPAALESVARLKDLVRIGHVRGIDAEIRILAGLAPDATEFVAALYRALDQFDLAGIGKILEDV